MSTPLFIVIVVIIICTLIVNRKLNRISDEINSIRSFLSDKNLRETEGTTSPPPVPTPPTPPPFNDKIFDGRRNNPGYDTSVLFPENEHLLSNNGYSPLPDTSEKKLTNRRDTQAGKKKKNLEKLIGENLFSKIGILALIVGIGFFVKFAIDSNWINETGRTIIGLAAGFIALAIAYMLRKNYRSFSSVLAGGGFAICFVTITIAHQLYNLLSWPATLTIMVALSFMLTGMALFENRRELAVIGVIGSFVAPFMIVSSVDSIVPLLTYTTILAGIQFIVSFRKRWWELTVISSILAWTVVWLCTLHTPSVTSPFPIIILLSILFALFSFPIAALHENIRNPIFILNVLLMVVNPLIYIYFSLEFTEGIFPYSRFKGFFPILAALVNVLVWWHISHGAIRSLPAEVSKWMAVVLAALFMPIQFSSISSIALGFSLYSFLLFVAFLKSGRNYLIYSSLATVGISLLWIIWDLTLEISDTSLLIIGITYCVMASLAVVSPHPFFKISHSFPSVFFGIMVNLGTAFLSFYLYEMTQQMAPEYTFIILLLFITTSTLAISILGLPGILTYGWLPLLCVISLALYSFVENFDSGLRIWTYWIATGLAGCSTVMFAKRTIGRKDELNLNINSLWIYFSLITSFILVLATLTALQQCAVENYLSAGVSIGLIISASVLMAGGMYWKKIVLRAESLLLFAILLVKLIAHDIWSLPVIGRIVVLILLGCVLLAISFLYQKFKTFIFKPDTLSSPKGFTPFGKDKR